MILIQQTKSLPLPLRSWMLDTKTGISFITQLQDVHNSAVTLLDAYVHISFQKPDIHTPACLGGSLGVVVVSGYVYTHPGCLPPLQILSIVREEQSRELVVMGQIYDAGMGYRLLYARELPSSLGFHTSGVPAVYLLPVSTRQEILWRGRRGTE